MDLRPTILNILKRRPQSYGIANGSNLHKLQIDDVFPLSKKTYALLIGHEGIPTLTRVFIGKIDGKGDLRNYYPLDIPGNRWYGELMNF